jgi:hypothetical protein
MNARCTVTTRLFILILAACLTTGTARGQSKTGTALGDFLLIEPSARIAGMGNAGASLFDGVQAAYYNPAALGSVGRREAWFSHIEWLAGISYDYAAAALPLGGLGNLSASVTALSSGEIDVRTVEQPQGTGERYSVSDVAVGLGYGRQITDRFAAGVQVSYVQETIWHSTAQTAGVNIGTLYRLSEGGLHIGSSLSNFGTRTRFSGRDLRILYDQDPTRSGDNGTLPGEVFTESYPVPVLFRVGVGMPYQISDAARMQLALDAFHPSDNTESVSAGAELVVKEILALRGGYQNLFQKDSEVGLTLGVGLTGKTQTLHVRSDYAWADHGRLGSTHRVSVGLTF